MPEDNQAPKVAQGPIFLILKLMRIMVPFLSLGIFIGATRLPDDIFTNIITINGIFAGFSVLVFSMTPFLGHNESIRTRFKPVIDQYALSKYPLLNQQQREKLVNQASVPVANMFTGIFGSLVTAFAWVIILIPYVVSILIASFGLLHEGILSWFSAVAATWVMVFGIISEIEILLESKIHSVLAEVYSNIDRQNQQQQK